MGNLKTSISLLLTSFLLSSCVSETVESAQRREIIRENCTTGVTSLMGTGEMIDGTRIEFSEPSSKPTILIFADLLCTTCQKEAQLLSNLFSSNNAVSPSNANLYTLMFGGFMDDAIEFRNNFNVTWPIGVDVAEAGGDFENDLYTQYCEQLGTPCVITFDPLNEKLCRFIGESSIDRWQEETVRWQY